MKPSLEAITRATIRLQDWDFLTGFPDEQALRDIRAAGLERFLPAYWNPDTREITLSAEALQRKIAELTAASYLTPKQALKYVRKRYSASPADVIHRLNYGLLQKALALSPTGEINQAVYIVATLQSMKEEGITMRDIQARYERSVLHAAEQGQHDVDLARYQLIMIGSNMRTLKTNNHLASVVVAMMPKYDTDILKVPPMIVTMCPPRETRGDTPPELRL